MKILLIILLFLISCRHHPMPTAAELDGSHVDSLASQPAYIAFRQIADSANQYLENDREVAENPEFYSHPAWLRRRYYDSINRIVKARRAIYSERAKRYLDSIRKHADTNSIDITPQP